MNCIVEIILLSQLYLFNIIIILSFALTKYTNSHNSTEHI